MKKLLLSAGAFALAMSAGAQTYFSEDFNGGTLGQFSSIDNDGDTYEWDVADVSGSINSDGSSAISNSWTSGTGPLTPDNILVSTSAVDLTGASGTITLTWRAGNLETTNNWWEENYDVILSTGNSAGAITSATPVFSEVLPSGGAMLDRSVDVSAFAGQMVYLSFRHYNCTDENFLIIDDVEVKTLLSDDAAVTALSIAPVVQAGNVSITGTITNEGANTINSFDLSWDDGTGPYTETINQTIASGGTYNFTHGTQLNAQVGTAYSIDVCVALTGDMNSANDCMTANVGVVSSVPTKYTLGEEKTGTWCGWCPRGATSMAGMESTSTFIGVAVHNGDPMTVSAYDSNIGTYVPGGYPGAGVDRVVDGDPTDFPSMHSSRVNEIAPASITVTAVENGSNIDVTVTADWVMTANGVNYRLGAIVTEDDVMGSGAGWSQTNYYDGGGAGPLTDPVTGFDWTTAGDPVAPSAFGGYDHVARALGNNQIMGDAGSVPSSITDGGSTDKSYTFASSTFDDLQKCKFIGILVDANTGEVLNAGYTTLGGGGGSGIEENSTSSLSIYPNPTNDIANIAIELTEGATVSVEIINTLGQVVYTNGQAELAAGQHILPVSVADFAAGIYTVKTTVNGVVQTELLSVK